MALLEGCKHELAFTIPVMDVEAETAKVLADIQKKAKLPGFRPGKAPLSLIRSRFAQDVDQQVLENLIPKALGQRFRDENFDVVGRPEVKDLKFEKGQPIEFKATFEVAPQFELGEYVGLEAPYAEPSVTDEDVDKRVTDLRETKADYVNEDPRPAADGDHAVVALEAIEGADVKNDDMMIEVGAEDTMPQFSEALRGTQPGEEKLVEVSYPEDYAGEKLAGKTVKFRLTLKQLRRKELPELNDEFAQDLGDYKTVEELKEAVRRAIFREREVEAQEKAKAALIDKLVDSHEFPVPDAYVDRQIETQAEGYLRNLAAQGVDIRKLNLDWEKLRESQKDRATRDVKASLLLDKVADREAIAATNDEVDKEIQRIARQTREAPAGVRMRLEKDGSLGRIAATIRTQKTLQFLFDKSRKVAG